MVELLPAVRVLDKRTVPDRCRFHMVVSAAGVWGRGKI